MLIIVVRLGVALDAQWAPLARGVQLAAVFPELSATSTLAMITWLQELLVEVCVTHELFRLESEVLHQLQHLLDLRADERIELARLAAVQALLPALDHFVADHPNFGEPEEIMITDRIFDLFPVGQLHRAFLSIHMLGVVSASVEVGARLVEPVDLFIVQHVVRTEVVPDLVHLVAVVLPFLLIVAQDWLVPLV